MPKVNWETRLSIRIDDPSGEGDSNIVSPVYSITPTVRKDAEILDSIEEGNLGYIKKYVRFTFEIAVPPVSEYTRKIDKLLLQGQEFNIVMNPKEGDDWVYETILLKDCIITSGGFGTFDRQLNLPVVRYSGLALGVVIDNTEVYS